MNLDKVKRAPHKCKRKSCQLEVVEGGSSWSSCVGELCGSVGTGDLAVQRIVPETSTVKYEGLKPKRDQEEHDTDNCPTQYLSLAGQEVRRSAHQAIHVRGRDTMVDKFQNDPDV
jgi:hypothetical protein